MVTWILVIGIAWFGSLQLLMVQPTPLASSLWHTGSNTTPRWAYVFLLADCNPNQPTYRGMLYNILSATWLLQQYKSRADVVVLVQMTSVGLFLPEEPLLKQLRIQIRYLPPPDHPPTFYELVMAKFHVLTMTEYSKIIFLDGDVLPLCNLDYLMDLSTRGRLGDTLLHAMYEDPVNAGLFLISPQPNDDSFVRWNNTLTQQNRPPIDFRLWDGKVQSGWDFYCGDSDQGFLLYRSRVWDHSQSASIIVGSIIEHYAATLDLSWTPLEEQRQPTLTESTDFMGEYSCPKGPWALNANPQAAVWPFYRDFFHMVGYSKAWESAPENVTHPTTTRDYWYWVLQQVVDQIDPHHLSIPYPIENLPNILGKPKLRGDLFFTRPGPT